jgi:hypothetical protein
LLHDHAPAHKAANFGHFWPQEKVIILYHPP